MVATGTAVCTCFSWHNIPAISTYTLVGQEDMSINLRQTTNLKHERECCLFLPRDTSNLKIEEKFFKFQSYYTKDTETSIRENSNCRIYLSSLGLE